MSPPPKALFVSYTAVLGGAERILLDCATAVDHAVLACPEGPLASAARELGLPVVALRPRRLELRGSARERVGAAARIASHARELRRLVGELRPELVVAWSMRPLLSGAATLRTLRPRPRLLFQHNDLLPSPGVARAVRGAARLADRVVCLSHAIAADLDPHGALSTAVVHPGVDLERFAPSSGPPPEGRVLALGAIVPWKRHELALEVVARLPGAHLTVAGAPLDAAGEGLLARLRERARRPDLAGRVDIPGTALDARQALTGSAALLHCSDREPFGVALVEALACGVPVAAPAAGGPLEIVDESCGALYPPGDATAAAAALERVLSEPQLREGARARAEGLFDRERSRARFRELVAELGS